MNMKDLGLFSLIRGGSGKSQQCVKILEGRVQTKQSQALFSHAQRQEAVDTKSNTGWSRRTPGALPCFEGNRALAQVAHSLWSLLSRRALIASCSGCSCLSRCWAKWTQSSILCDGLILDILSSRWGEPYELTAAVSSRFLEPPASSDHLGWWTVLTPFQRTAVILCPKYRTIWMTVSLTRYGVRRLSNALISTLSQVPCRKGWVSIFWGSTRQWIQA